MSRYFNIGVIVMILLFILPSSSFGLDGEGFSLVQKRCEDVPLYRDDADISHNNGMLYTRYPLNIAKRIYGAISRVDGNRCPMYPTCSHYSIEAIEKHGFLIGIIMTCDRLIHESNEMDYAPLVEVGDTVKYADPVENNDFWWSD
jgi:hypothetical protein